MMHAGKGHYWNDLGICRQGKSTTPLHLNVLGEDAGKCVHVLVHLFQLVRFGRQLHQRVCVRGADHVGTRLHSNEAKGIVSQAMGLHDRRSNMSAPPSEESITLTPHCAAM